MRTDIIHDLVTNFADELGYDFLSFDINQNDMCAYHFVDLVSFDVGYYNPTKLVEFKKEIKKWYNKNGYKFDIHVGTFGLLHEMGHLIATHDLDDDELEDKLGNYNFAQIFINDDDLKTYKSLDMEREADQVAYQIYTEHTDLVRALDKAILEEIHR